MLYRLGLDQWWTAYWRLGRKIEKQGGKPSANDCRKAAILCSYADRASAAGNLERMADASRNLEWVIEYGKADFIAKLAAAKAAQDLGS